MNRLTEENRERYTKESALLYAKNKAECKSNSAQNLNVSNTSLRRINKEEECYVNLQK